VEKVQKGGALFCGAVCCKYESAWQTPLPPGESTSPYLTGMGSIYNRQRIYAFRDNTRFSEGLDLTVAHAVARIDAGVDMLWFDMQPKDLADQRTLRNKLKWEAMKSFKKGLRDSPDILIGSDIYHQPYFTAPIRKDASCFDYRVEQGGKLFYENPDEKAYWGNPLFRNGAGKYISYGGKGTAARLDTSSTKINFCHGWLYYTGSGWTAGLYEKKSDAPVLCFIDWSQPTTDFMQVPTEDQCNFFRITVAELMACGWKYCFPINAWSYDAKKAKTYSTIRELIHFYNHWAELFRNRQIKWTTTPTHDKSAHSFPNCLTVKVGVEGGNGVMRNGGNSGLSYMVNDQPQKSRRMVHLFNHNFKDYKVTPQKGVRLTLPLEFSVKRAYLISPDLSNPLERKKLSFTVQGDTVITEVDIKYYNVVVFEG